MPLRPASILSPHFGNRLSYGFLDLLRRLVTKRPTSPLQNLMFLCPSRIHFSHASYRVRTAATMAPAVPTTLSTTTSNRPIIHTPSFATPAFVAQCFSVRSNSSRRSHLVSGGSWTGVVVIPCLPSWRSRCALWRIHVPPAQSYRLIMSARRRSFSFSPAEEGWSLPRTRSGDESVATSGTHANPAATRDTRGARRIASPGGEGWGEGFSLPASIPNHAALPPFLHIPLIHYDPERNRLLRPRRPHRHNRSHGQ